jgi:hypothetical protein
MRAFTGIALFILCAALALSSPRPGNSAETNDWGVDFTKWHVHVVNGFGGQRALEIHCKSDIDDLGTHTLTPGSDFNWHFRVNLPGTTRFSCDFHKDNQHASFDVFWPESKDHWLRYRCNFKECFWIAKDDGIYIRNIPEGNRDEFFHGWET